MLNDSTGINELDAELHSRMIEVRRHLHRYPELSNNERETQIYLKAALEAQGLSDVREVAGFGLAVDIVGTAVPSNRKVVIRADIDALPIEEQSGEPFSSVNAGVMHACGHDAHSAMGFATAVLFHRGRSKFSGTVRMIFQPAEEAEPVGARRIVAEGLLKDVDGAIGIHVDPYMTSGKIAVGSGPYTLACDNFDAIVVGSSAHAAKPSEGVDAIAVACSMVSELQKIVSREIDPFDPLVVSVTGIEGGGAYNVIASKVTLKGTIRCGNDATRIRARERVQQILEGIAAAHAATVTLSITHGEPAVINDPEMTEIVRRNASRLLGDDNSISAPGWTAADDFGYYSEKLPSVYFRLGIRDETAGSVYPLHHPKFRVDETALTAGVSMLVATAQDFLEI